MDKKNKKNNAEKRPHGKKTTNDTAVIDRIASNRIVMLFKNNAFCMLSAALTLFVLLLSLSLSKVNFGFGGKASFLYSDLFAELVPMLTELRERLLSGDFSLWSWATGMGGNYLGTVYYYLLSPFNAAVLFTDNIESAVIVIMFLKVSLSAFTASYFFKKAYADKSAVNVIFGCAYALCGWLSAYYFLLMWLDALYILPLLLLGCRRIIDEKKPALLFFSAAYIIIVNFYMAYMLIIFAALYWFAYFFSTRAKTERNGEGWGILKHSPFFVSFTLTIGAGIAAVLVSCAVIIPELLLISRSGAGNIEALTVNPTLFSRITETLSALIPQSDRIRLLTENEYPNIYSGVLALSLAPLYFLNKSISAKRKLCFGALFALVTASLFSGALAYVWHGFAEVNDFPYRFSFVFSFLLICFACTAIVNREGLTVPRVLISAGLALCVQISVLLFKINGADSAAKSSGIVIALILTLIYTALVCSLRTEKTDLRAVIAVMLALTLADACADFTVNIATAVDDASVRTEKENVLPLVEKQKELAGEELSRSELSLPISYNQGAWYGYNGVSISSSLINESLLSFCSKIGLHTNKRDGMRYYAADPVSNSLLSLNYVYDDATDDYTFNDTRLFGAIKTNGAYTLYENKYALPALYAVDSDMTGWGGALDDTDIYGNINAFTEAAAGTQSVLTGVQLTPASLMPNMKLTENTDGSFSFDNHSLAAGTVDLSFTAEYSSSYYFSININFENEYKGASVSSGTLPAAVKARYDLPYSVYIGYYNKGETVPISVNINSLSKGSFTASAACVDYNKLDEYYNRITANGVFSTEEFTSGKIEGSITLSEDKFIMTSIPFDKGWRVYANGRQLSDNEVYAVADALLGFSLPAGTHSVRIVYSYTPFVVGMGISVLSTAALIAYAVIRQKKKNRLLTEAQ